MACLVVSGCATNDGVQRPKKIDVSNLVKTKQGTYKLVSEKEINNDASVSKGNALETQQPPKEISIPLPAKGETSSIKIGKLNYKVEVVNKKSSISAKNDTRISDEIPQGEVVILSPMTEEKSGAKVDWSALVLYWIVIAWLCSVMWIIWKAFSAAKKTSKNPFVQKEKDPQPEAENPEEPKKD